MNDLRTISYTITVNGVDQSAAGINRVAGTTENATASMAASYAKLAAAAAAVYGIIKKLEETALLAARVETLGVVMEVVGNNAGYSAAEMEKYAASVAKMGITTEASRQTVIQMASSHMDLKRAAELARVAQDAAVIGNINSSDAFERMIHGIRSGEIEILRTIGINVNFQQSYEKLATQLGRNVQSLTETEKIQARTNAVLEKGTDLAGSYAASMDTAGKMLNSMKRPIDELQLALGNLSLPILTEMVRELYTSLSDLARQANSSEGKKAFAEWAFAALEAFSLVKADIIRISMLVDKLGGSMTSASMLLYGPGKALGVKSSTERFDRMADYNLMFEARFNEKEKQLQAMADGLVKWENKLFGGGAGGAGKPGKQGNDTPAPDEEATKRLNDYIQAYNQLQDARRAGNPYLTEEQKALVQLADKYDNLIAKYPEHRAELERNLALDKQQIAVTHQLKRAEEDWAESVKNFEEAEKSRAAVMQQGQAVMDSLLTPTQKYLAEVEKLDLLLGDDALTLETYRLAVERLNEDLAKLALDQAHANDALKNDITQNDMFTDPYTKELKAIDERYGKEIGWLKEVRKVRALTANEQERYNLLELASSQDLLKAKIGMYSEYAAIAGGIMGQLAGMMDQKNRDQFEASKALSIGQAIMSTAAAVMNAMANMPYPANLIAAAATAVMGALQVRTIINTSYGGGGNVATGVPAAAGSYASSGNTGPTGSGIGSPYLSVRDAISPHLEDLARSADNASLAIGRVADGLTELGDLFSEGRGQLAVNSAPGMGMTPVTWEPPGTLGQLWNVPKNQMSGIGDMVTAWVRDMGKVFTDLDFKGMLVSQWTNVIAGPTMLMWDTLFGHGPWEPTSTGLSLGVKGGDLSASQYTEYLSKGGWFASDKTKTENTALDEAFSGVLSAYLEQIKATLTRGAVSIGTITDFAGIDIPDQKIATAGRKPEDIAKDLNDWFVKVAGTLAQGVKGLQEFTFYGESAFDALVRLSTSLQGVNEKLSLIGATLVDSTLAGANAAYKLSDMMGGLDKFAEKVDTYFETMYSEEEQKQRKALEAQRQVNVAFAEMNEYARGKMTGLHLGGFDMSLPDSREEFRDLVNGLDLTTEAGAALFAGLMDIAEAFGTVMDAADDAAEKAKEFARLQDDSFLDLQVRLLRAAGQTARADLMALFIQQSKEWHDYMEKGLDTTQLVIVQQLEYANALKQVGEAAQQASDQLKNTLVDTALAAAQALKQILGGDLSTASPEQKYISARRAWDDAMAKGQANLLPELGQALLTSSRGYNASGAGYVSDFDRVTQALADAAGIIGEPTLTAAQQQVQLLTDIKAFAGLQVTGMTTMAELMSQYLSQSAAQNVLNMATGLAAADLRWDLNKSGAIDIADALLALQGQRPSFAVGTPYVTHDMTADIHQGEMIWTRQFSEGMRRYGIPVQGAADNRELVAELKEVKAELREIKAHAAANVKVAQAVGTKTIAINEQQAETQDELLRVTKRSAA